MGRSKGLENGSHLRIVNSAESLDAPAGNHRAVFCGGSDHVCLTVSFTLYSNLPDTACRGDPQPRVGRAKAQTLFELGESVNDTLVASHLLAAVLVINYDSSVAWSAHLEPAA
jgi:hypothetical protein